MNTKKQGDMGMGACIAYFTSIGVTVSIPLTDSQDYDLIVEIDGVLKKVQVKTTSAKKYGMFLVTLKTSGGNKTGMNTKLFTQNSSDFLFVFTSDGTKYFIPNIDLPGRSMLLNQSKSKYIVK